MDAHDNERSVLVHGDVHQWNTLEAGGGFKLVDPDGLLAEPEYDLGVMMREDPVELLYGDPFARARHFAAATGLDPDRDLGMGRRRTRARPACWPRDRPATRRFAKCWPPWMRCPNLLTLPTGVRVDPYSLDVTRPNDVLRDGLPDAARTRGRATVRRWAGSNFTTPTSNKYYRDGVDPHGRPVDRTTTSKSVARIATGARGGYCFHLNGGLSELFA